MQVLVIDDSLAVRNALSLLFRLHGLDVSTAASPQQALDAVATGGIGVAVQDMNFAAGASSGEEGVALFRALRARDAALPIVLLTAWADLERAIELVREGADDYVAKPWDDGKLVEKVKRLLALRAVARERADTRDLAGLVYASAEMHAVVSLALRVAPADVPVLITGPSGSGKERIAELIRVNSSRRDRPFVVMNAGALPATLLEAELFGAEAGAYTGAAAPRKGRFEAADGGTLFIDEIGTLPAGGQAALLRVLATGDYQRLGSSATRRCDVRLLAATNDDLPAAIAAGGFRADLYYRLAVIEIAVPPLCERVDDIDALADHFLRGFGVEPDAVDGTARRAMREYPWPGNVRELENRLQRAALIRTGPRIGVAELGLGAASGAAPAAGGDAVSERARVEEALREADGVVSRAAEALGLSRASMYRRMERLGLKLERRLKP